MDPQSFYGLAGVPLVVALVQLVKVSEPALPEHYWPAVALLVGVVFNVGLALAMGTGLAAAVLVGVVTGLSASGLYSYSRVGDRR
ncbi:MAG TPA: hypothetical protein VFZ25_18940 [Chloroflexota bacterium]|nr:hypothetical protein [Chloroflexota bacterium]